MRMTLASGLLTSFLVACGGGAAAPATTTTAASATHAHGHDPSSHNHDRGQMMIASNGVVDALLTSHLSSKSGNELDVFVEKNGAPLALNVTTLRMKARTTEGTEDKTLELACAPADERPAGEAGGMCSHFVAAAPWMKNDDRLEVRVTLPLLSGETPYTWRRFDPLRYAHHIE